MADLPARGTLRRSRRSPWSAASRRPASKHALAQRRGVNYSRRTRPKGGPFGISGGLSDLTSDAEVAMANPSVYLVTDLVGTSKPSWEDAAKNAIQTAAKSLRDLRVAEVIRLDVTIDKGKVITYRTRLNVSFKYEK